MHDTNLKTPTEMAAFVAREQQVIRQRAWRSVLMASTLIALMAIAPRMMAGLVESPPTAQQQILMEILTYAQAAGIVLGTLMIGMAGTLATLQQRALRRWQASHITTHEESA